MAEERPRLVITTDSLPDLPAAAPFMAAPTGDLPSAPPVFAATGSTNFFGTTLGMSLIGALIAILPAWLIGEAVSNAVDGGTNWTFQTAVWTAALGAVFGGIYSAWPDAMSRVWERAGIAFALGAIFGGIGGAIAGAAAQKIYENLLGDFPSNTTFYVARGIAWGVFGLLAGAAIGGAQRVPKKALFGLIGGAVGGAIGGLIFEALAQATNGDVSDWLLRLIGLFFVFGLMGIAIGLVETGMRQAWVRIVAGGMTGKEFIIYLDATDIGTSPKCQITLIKDPSVHPYHCRIQSNGRVRRVTAYQGATVTVNGQPVMDHVLRNGDLIGVGQTAIQYADRS